MSKLSEEQKEKIKGIVAEHLGHDAEHILDDSALQDDLGGDSLDSVELIMELEKEFDISIKDEEYAFRMRVKDLYTIVERHL